MPEEPLEPELPEEPEEPELPVDESITIRILLLSSWVVVETPDPEISRIDPEYATLAVTTVIGNPTNDPVIISPDIEFSPTT